jgi:hypothetical protein
MGETSVFQSGSLSMRLNGGLRQGSMLSAAAVLQSELGVPLELELDEELGGRHYRYAPHPLPSCGVAGVSVHANAIPEGGFRYRHRPDLQLVVLVDLFGSNLLDPGRLDRLLRDAFGDRFDVAEYSIAALPTSGEPLGTTPVHYVEFEAGERAVADTPRQSCKLEIALSGSAELIARAQIASLRPSLGDAELRLGPLSGGMSLLTVEYESPSLLGLGACVQQLEQACGAAVHVRRYRARGDLLRDGRSLTVEQSFDASADAIPCWKAFNRLA